MSLVISRRQAEVIEHAVGMIFDTADGEDSPVSVRIVQAFSEMLKAHFDDCSVGETQFDISVETMVAVEQTLGVMIYSLRRQPRLPNVGAVVAVLSDVYSVFHYGRRAQEVNAACA